MIQHWLHKDEFFRYISSLDPSIQFTVEESKADGSKPFSNTIITPLTDGTFTTDDNRNGSHKDLYLPWDSHHNLAAKYSVINTLSHRAKTICSTPELLQHLEEVLMLCKYHRWAINKIINKQEDQRKSHKNKQTPSSQQSVKKCHIIVPSVQCTCE